MYTIGAAPLSNATRIACSMDACLSHRFCNDSRHVVSLPRRAGVYLLTYLRRTSARLARAAGTRRPRGVDAPPARPRWPVLARGGLRWAGPRAAAEPSTIDVRAAGGAVRVVTSEPPCLTGRVVATPRSRASPGSRSAIRVRHRSNFRSGVTAHRAAPRGSRDRRRAYRDFPFRYLNVNVFLLNAIRTTRTAPRTGPRHTCDVSVRLL